MGCNRVFAASVAFAALVVVVPALRAQEGRPQVNRQADRVETNDEMQPDKLPALPPSMTIPDIVTGDRIFHGKGGCFACHGTEGEGLPAAGDAITVGFNYIPSEWPAIDSLVTAGIPDALTRSPIAMPPRGAKSDLSPEEIRRVAAYVWAINKVRGEPWPGGHSDHLQMTPPGATHGTAVSKRSP